MIELQTVQYRTHRAVPVNGISLRFRDHRFNVLIGPNGAGKSTLLRLAAGLLRPTAGTVFYDDRPTAALDATALARKRAFLSQHSKITVPLTVKEIVQMGRYPHYTRMPAQQDLEIVRRALDLVGMSETRDRSYLELSAGEQQRIQLARALAQIWDDEKEHGNKYLFLDEPTSNLDIHHQIRSLDIVRNFLNRNCTVIAVLHDLNAAARYGDNFFAMDRGHLVFETDTAENLHRDMIERVFRVTAHKAIGSVQGKPFWHFTLSS
jgi:iron complex transport system ATP-binding protein